jgi:hypothetical protein
MRFFSPKLHLVPTPQFRGAGGAGGSSGQGAAADVTPPTPQNPGLATDANIGIDSEDGRVIDVNE